MKTNVFTSVKFENVQSASSLATSIATGNTKANLLPHSLVFVSNPNTKGDSVVYNIAANCRVANINAIIKAFIRVYLAVEREYFVYQDKAPDKTYTKGAKNPLSEVLKSTVIAVTDKRGNLIDKSGYCVNDFFGIANFRKLFSFKAGLSVWDMLVKDGKPWDDEEVQKAVTNYIVSIEMYTKVLVRLSDIIEETAIANIESYKASKKSVDERVKQSEKLLQSAKDDYNKANIALENANKAVNDNTDKTKVAALKKAAAAAAAKAKEAEADLNKKEKFLAMVKEEQKEYSEAV